MRNFKIFIASPGDVDEEREYATQVIHKLNGELSFSDVIKIQPIGWDQPGMENAMSVGRTPQDSIAMGLTQPRDCDLVLILLWAKMGTPLPKTHLKPDGSRYWSGTEWEYCNALEEFQRSGRPEIWMYHRQGAPYIPLNHPERDLLVTQLNRLESFLKQTTNSDGSIIHGINPYDKPVDFKSKFEQNLRRYLTSWLMREGMPSVPTLQRNNPPVALKEAPQVVSPFIRLLKGAKVPSYRPQTSEESSASLKKTVETPTSPDLALRGTPRFDVAHGQDGVGPWRALDHAKQRLLFRYVPAGEYQQGSPTSEAERRDDETRHDVKLSRGFWISDVAIPQALWEAVMGSNPSEFRHPMQPVEQVSWYQTQEFIQALERIFDYSFRLPTEAEWEYACRAGSRGPFSSGSQIGTHQANYDGHFPYDDGKRGPRHKRPVPVKSYPANDWGLYDMHGNVWEWCADWYGDYVVNADNTVFSDPSGPTQGSERVVRGGSWLSEAGQCRSASRYSFNPDYGSDELGFRVVMIDK